MSARNGVYVEKRQMPNGKWWVWTVVTRPEGAPLGFFDWYEMVRLLRECEEEKYRGRSADPLRLPREFFEALWAPELQPYELLAARFAIPARGQETVLEWEMPNMVCECGAFSPKACKWLTGLLSSAQYTCVSLMPEARHLLRIRDSES